MTGMLKVKGSEEKPACRTAKIMIGIKHRRKESDNQSLAEFVFYVLGKLCLAMGELHKNIHKCISHDDQSYTTAIHKED